MFVVQLIGRMADQVIETPYTAGTSGIASGIFRLATEAEIAAAGLEIPHEAPAITQEDGFPRGYRVEPTENGGFDLFDENGVRLNTQPYPNLLAARSSAIDNRDLAVTLQPVDVAANREILEAQLATSTPRTFTIADYVVVVIGDGAFNVRDPGGVILNDEPMESVDAARAFAENHLSLMLEQGEGPEDLDGDGADDSELVVPDDWKSLHHSKIRAIARKIGGEEPANTDAARAVIEDYLRRQTIG